VGLASVAALAVFVAIAPGARAAHPEWKVNGERAKANHVAVIDPGVIKLTNKVIGALECHSLASGSIWNESERGLGQTEGYVTYNCRAEPQCLGSFMAAETPVEIPERLRGKGEHPDFVKANSHGRSTLPWSEELVEPTENEVRLKTKGVGITVVLPCVGVEILFSGELEPKVENGAKNGLHPSRAIFLGASTGVLLSPVLEVAEEKNVGVVTGEVVRLGRSQQLITTFG
jgi:hypothetical protein